MKRLLLRADASVRMGTGHVMRCLALAQAWQDMGGETTLLSHALPAALAERMAAEGVHLQVLPDAAADAFETGRAAAEADWLVVDGYHFGPSYFAHVIQAARHTLMLDDLGQLPHFSAELILNQNISACESMYFSRDKGTSLLCGCSYALLRREFRRAHVVRGTSAACERVLVTLGGSDPENVTQKVINALEAVPQLRAKVVLGAANPRREALQEYCKARGGHIELVPPVEDMVPLMDWAHLAVSAGGTSVLELASRGVPTILLATADNQRAVCETMHANRVMLSVGWHEDASIDMLAATIRHLASEDGRGLRGEFTMRGTALVDGRGAPRVAREMMARDAMTSVRVRRAGAVDVQRVFDWANDPVTRSVSFDRREIPWEVHQAWFAKKLDDASCWLLIGEDTVGRALGMVRFDVDDRIATISINLAPEHRQRGIGTALLLVACREFMSSGAASGVTALIKPDNLASQRAFHRAGFEPAPDVDVAGQRALCMVLK